MSFGPLSLFLVSQERNGATAPESGKICNLSLRTPPACYRSLSGPSGPKCPRSVPESVPKKRGGVRGSVRRGVSGAPECQKVSRECPRSVRDTFLTLRGHSRTLFGHSGARARRGPDTPRRTLPRTPPVFAETLGDAPGTLRARRAQKTPVAGRGVCKLRVKRERESRRERPKRDLFLLLERDSIATKKWLPWVSVAMSLLLTKGRVSFWSGGKKVYTKGVFSSGNLSA